MGKRISFLKQAFTWLKGRAYGIGKQRGGEKPAPSIAELKKALYQEPSQVENHLLLGWFLYAAGRYEESAQVLETARIQFPDHLELWYALAMTHKQLKNNEGSIAAFQRVEQLAKQMKAGDRSRMIRRLARGHINQLERGVWSTGQ
jgi:tetratricopeptide (TPR) repeat protein